MMTLTRRGAARVGGAAMYPRYRGWLRGRDPRPAGVLRSRGDRPPTATPVSVPFDATGYDTDKSEVYLARYTRAFASLRERPVRLLELGVKTGGSLLMW